VNLQFFEEIDVENSKWNDKGRNLIFNIQKATPGAHWPRLTKEKIKDSTITVHCKLND
jgi:hypothetical protein